MDETKITVEIPESKSTQALILFIRTHSIWEVEEAENGNLTFSRGYAEDASKEQIEKDCYWAADFTSAVVVDKTIYTRDVQTIVR